jgi:uncharacterized phiE125 gp8 family phage protein
MTEPISTARATTHLRLTSDDPGYADLAANITAARKWVENYCNISVVNQTRTLKLDAFTVYPAAIASAYATSNNPVSDIVLPYGPVTSVTTIAYVDNNGDPQTVASHILTNYPMKDVLTPAYGEAWPSTRDQRGAVTITYEAGMMAGSPATLANEDLTSGILLVLGDLWENREGKVVGVVHSVNPTVDNLIHLYRRQLGI